MIPVAIALGSNLGERERLLHDGIAALGECVRDLRVSTFHDTDPSGSATSRDF